jgi:hypothetical protein
MAFMWEWDIGIGGGLTDDTNEMNGFDDHAWFTDGNL